MAHTVVGVFDTSNEAQTALQQLVSSGIARDFIDIAPQTASNTDRDEDNDSISNFFRNLFGSDDRTDQYSSYARNGAIVTVHARSAEEAELAADIMDDNGAVNLDERTSGYATGAAVTDSHNLNTGRRDTGTTDTTIPMGAAVTDSHNPDTGRRDTDTTDTTIPIIEEDMQVGKRTVETGGVRVRSRILERPVEEHLRLREEHVHVERNPVNRPATDTDLSTFKEGEIKMTEHAEVPIVDKEARVVEEIHIGKKVEEHDEAIRDTVRKTDVEVDKLSEQDIRRNRLDNDPHRNV